MIALLLAAALGGRTFVEPMAPGGTAEIDPMPNAFRQPSYCTPIVQGELKRQHVALHGLWPAVQYAVLRQIDGCMVPAPVGYHPSYLLPGAADVPAKPGDGPANRR